MAVFKRSTSDGVAAVGLFTPAMPVKKVVIRSVRGKLVGAKAAALPPPNTMPNNAGRVGLLT